jgi:hypothetical protein
MNLTAADGYLTGFTVGTTYGQLQERMKSINADNKLVVRDSEGNEVPSDTAVASGQKMEVTDGQGTSTYTIILKGDINGDGRIDLRDALGFKKDILSVAKLTGSGRQAALINGETEVSLRGYLALKKHILGIQQITQ